MASGCTDAVTPAGTWNGRVNFSSSFYPEFVVEEQLVGAGASANASVTTGSSTTWAMSTVVFKAAATPPSAPTNVTATPGNSQATVTWTAPASNGGSQISGYTVTSSPGELTPPPTATPPPPTPLPLPTATTTPFT